MDWREKIESDFLMCACGLGTTNFLPVIYAYIYNRGDAVQTNRTGVVARIVYGYILSMVDVNLAQIGTDGATRL